MEILFNKKTILLVLLSVLSGLLGGFLGLSFYKEYLIKDAYQVPIFGDLNLPRNINDRSNLIIDSPRNVIVEQDIKIRDTINSVHRSLVGIFDNAASTSLASTSPKVFRKDKALGQGIAITSDGWIISAFYPKDLPKNASSTSIAKSFSIADSGGKTYPVLDVVIDHSAKISYWRIPAQGLSVRPYRLNREIWNGQTCLYLDYFQQANPCAITNKRSLTPSEVMDSDQIYSEIDTDSRDKKRDRFLFSLEGDLLAIADADSKLYGMDRYYSGLNAILEKRPISHPVLGIRYVNMSQFSYAGDDLTKNGALIFPDKNGIAIATGSPAAKAGFKNGDLIISVNADSLNANQTLSDLIALQKPGSSVDFNLIRNGKEQRIKAIIGQEKVID